jgi:hypothetical protein
MVLSSFCGEKTPEAADKFVSEKCFEALLCFGSDSYVSLELFFAVYVKWKITRWIDRSKLLDLSLD